MFNYLGFLGLASKLRIDARTRVAAQTERTQAERTDRREAADLLSPEASEEWLRWVSRLPVREPERHS